MSYNYNDCETKLAQVSILQGTSSSISLVEKLKIQQKEINKEAERVAELIELLQENPATERILQLMNRNY